MLYWVTNAGKFNKTSKFSPPKNSISNALKREKDISEHLKDVQSEYISIPSWELSSEGIPVIIQEYLQEGDLLEYLMKFPNRGLKTATIFLDCIRNILPIFQAHNVSFGDFALENFMVQTDMDGYLNKLTLIDYGQAVIFNETMKPEWNPKEYLNVRPYLLPPDMFTDYNNKCFMEIKDIQKLLLKKDMFVIGILLYMILSGSELWNLNTTPEIKIHDLIKHRSYWKNSINKANINPVQLIIFNILLGLLSVKMDDMITLDELYQLIDTLDDDHKSYNSKKRQREE